MLKSTTPHRMLVDGERRTQVIGERAARVFRDFRYRTYMRMVVNFTIDK
jgi:hypothetical protein